MDRFAIATPRVIIQTADFDLGAEVARLRDGDKRVGAVCSFIGTVRDRTAGGPDNISAMELEHYPGMTEKAIEWGSTHQHPSWVKSTPPQPAYTGTRLPAGSRRRAPPAPPQRRAL